ncbi:DoxX family protein [Spongiactinospora sp. TRM90649]|uniref:DoxX family protein n=1 Tax=Spongiactinospora sp. TRM90649 TaxID=3031114 RepID=UPI0023F999AA|nr:DoxX family protein [Spongiactinospora sp. TRM90649]MDF5755274.1 DoxX family protein [Spongiactinospora sp. TRM90649]
MRRWLYDIAALIARIVVGVVFIAHGLQKLAAGGVGPVAAGFAESGVPMPQVAAGFTLVVELVGGALLVLGLFTPLAGLLLVVVCLGAAIFVHARHGIFVDRGGFELVGGLGSAALLLAAGGAGRFSLDHLFFGRRRARALREADQVTPGAWYGGPEAGRSAGPSRYDDGADSAHSADQADDAEHAASRSGGPSAPGSSTGRHAAQGRDERPGQR